MIKIVQVSSDTNIGGAGKCILTFLKLYDRKKFDVSVILPVNSLLKPLVQALNVKVYEVENIAEKSLSMSGVSSIKDVLKRVKPDIVHTHASMSARIAARLCGIKIVYTRHSVFPPPPRISKGIGKLINGFVNNITSDSIIAVAEAAKQNLTDTGVSDKNIRVVLNGVDALRPYTEQEIDEYRKKYGIQRGQKVAAIVARLNEVKGHKYFVDAAKIVTDRGIDAKFLIAGTGEVQNSLKEQIRELGLEDRVIMLGFLDNVEPLMNVLDVQVNCSFGTEATSLSLLEGMSLGKPAVVTDFGGNPGVIENGKNGFLVPTHNAKAIAEKIISLFENEALYNEIRNNCFKIYKDKFTSEVYTGNIEKVYSDLFKTRRNP